ncbi:response regulator transcription factor [Caulobacter sp. SSI4214]|uniref:response regulator n=1 Tax=Caulobacter sp. SSI4214 TaxID=2575739 RepID=UPI00143C632F|nr:response regulator transcription factor [Caulobacter sp. SSI4214]
MIQSGAQILLVDDEPQLVRALTPALGAAGYGVATADSGQAALAHLAAEGCDAVILDLGLPDLDGKAVIGRIREWSEVPIVVLSARDIEQEKIAALDLGADDFINKPFGVGELLARLRAAMRGRDRRFSARAHFKSGELEINFADRRVVVQGQEIRLTPREYDLLRSLARYAGRVVTHRQLMAAVWGPDAEVDAQFVRVLVGQVRQKIEEEPSAPKLLLTEPGLGYRLTPEDEG